MWLGNSWWVVVNKIVGFLKFGHCGCYTILEKYVRINEESKPNVFW